MNLPRPIRVMVATGATLVSGIVALSLASSVTLKVIKYTAESKRKEVAKPCVVCREKGFYICKLCNGNNSIKWSPLFDPIAINPCRCPTCDGHGIQHCLNCLGKGYF